MKITRDNYEIYFIDYLDGTLPPELIGELKAFLLVNRDLEEQLRGVANNRLPIPSETFSDKASLKKDSVHECPDYYAIATAENTLTANDRKVLGKRIDSEVFQTLVQTYRNLKLRPDQNIRYGKKARLFRKSPVRLWIRTAGVAAGLLLLASIGISLLQTGRHKAADVPSYSFILLQPEEITLSDTLLPVPEQPDARQLAAKRPLRQTRADRPIKPRKKPDLPEELFSPVPTLTPVFAKVENNLPETHPELLVYPPVTDEIFLTADARVWKQSGEGFLSDNIIGSAYFTGKNLAGKIKEKITEIRSNKSVTEYVIE